VDIQVYTSERFYIGVELNAGYSTNEPLHLQLDLSFNGGPDQIFEYQLPVSSAGSGAMHIGPGIAFSDENFCPPLRCPALRLTDYHVIGRLNVC